MVCNVCICWFTLALTVDWTWFLILILCAINRFFFAQICYIYYDFHLSSSDRDMSRNVWNRPSGSLWSIWGSHQTLWSLPFPNVTWHSGTWPYTMTPSIDQTLHQFASLLPNWTLIPILTLLPNFGGFHRTLQRVRLANRGRLLLRTPGPVPFGTCFPELVISTDLLSFEHPSVLLFCSLLSVT